ncbi:hypothetical protein J5226_04855 [Lysobacter sp. K5869]|uniref:DUF6622 family protein n=1 Tax=Lysobacter sp. K5869 TaxID=2820808 RepID=UPI001C061393|nr:DUF6622 family protein [Lysobacter sp. K5869]QWP77748.1 hypothetical protein J5226_04855 [Lysobacter sp. K5869]
MHATQLLQGTPLWVYAIFAVLLYLGLRRLRSGVQSLARVWAVPAVFIAWGLFGLAAHAGAPLETLARWFVGALAGGALGYGSLDPAALAFDHQRRLVRQPGSALPLLRNLGIFGAHYVLQVIAAIQPQLHDSALGWDLVVSGFSAGYFAGWAVRFLAGQRRAPQTDLAAMA